MTDSRVVVIADRPEGASPTPAHCGPSSAITASCSAFVVGVPRRPYWNSPRWACRSSVVGYSTVEPWTTGGLTNPFCALVSRPAVTKAVSAFCGLDRSLSLEEFMRLPPPGWALPQPSLEDRLRAGAGWIC